MNSKLKLLLCASTGLMLTTASFASEWSRNNGPDSFGRGRYDRYFQSLPLSGSVPNSNIPWSDSYWPKNRGGAAYRWHAHSNENLSATISPAEAQYMFFGIELPSKDQLLSMSQVQIADLSPAEKFDIFQGNFDYPMTKAFLGRKHSSRKMRNSSQDLYWEGYCNAWSAVSLHYSEPKPVTRTIYIRGQAVQIPFGSGDIKALMVASYAEDLGSNPQMGNFCHKTFTFPATKVVNGREVFAQYPDTDGLLESQYPDYVRKFQADVRRIGTNPMAYMNRGDEINPFSSDFLSEMTSRKNSDDCQDTNAGAFHIMMSNQLGKLHEGFVIDKTRDNEIWNQPVFKFASKVVGDTTLSANHAAGAVRAVQVKTSLYYADDTDYGWTYWNPTLTNLFTTDNGFLEEFARYGRMLMKQGDETEMPVYPANVIDKAHYIYNLELNASGEIVGGEWVTFDRPDIAWFPRRFSFSGDYKGINDIYEPLQIPANAVLNFGADE